MPAPHNTLKAALATKTVQMGLWMNLVSPIAAEALAGAGFDWLLIDGEHGPNDIPTILAQVQAIGSRTSVVVRPPVGEVRMIKQLLDLGVQTILVPMIESADHAAQMVKAMHYPPVGMRGVGATIARASDYGRITDYITTANDQTCLILQIESRAGLAALPEILKLDGVDGVFIGPADLAADMGYPGNAAAPEVQATIDSTLAAIMASGKSAGILTFDAKAAQRYAAMGVTFLGIGSDVAVLVKAMTATLQAAKAG
jgi:4-hydroxy-2-oxoheptanedioate aldolase